MLKSILVLPNGSELSSGVGTVDAIASIKLTQCVNDSRELNPGSVCASMLEAKLITPGGGCSLKAGDEVHLYREEGSVRHDMGLFTLEEPLRASANTLSITAYDRVSWLDKDLSDWLDSLTGWPYSLQEFAGMVCEECGLELENGNLPNGDFAVPAFAARGITGRQLMQWIAQAAGRFCRATTEGKLEFAWYTPTELTVGPGAGSHSLYYYMGGLKYEDYTVAPIEKVQIKLTQSDVGAVYPDTQEVCNTYAVSGNYLLTATMAEALEPVAETLYEQLRGMTYTPCTITMPATTRVSAGDSITVLDPNGISFTTLVMTKTQAGQQDTLTCTGSPRRDSTGAVNAASYKALSGKVLELKTDIEGLRAENRDAAGNLSRLEMDLHAISTEISRQQQDTDSLRQSVTQIQQDADSFSLEIRKLQNDGVSKVETATGFTFDEQGLHIEKSGQEVSTRIDHTGMMVSRGGENVLRATAEGVKAIDITVKNYLVVGDHARLENYTDGLDSRRTACFFI